MQRRGKKSERKRDILAYLTKLNFIVANRRRSDDFAITKKVNTHTRSSERTNERTKDKQRTQPRERVGYTRTHTYVYIVVFEYAIDQSEN